MSGIQITDYRVDRWLHHASNGTLYGVSVKIAGTKGWVRVSEGGKSVILDRKADADACIAGMKSERDAQGFMPAPPPSPLQNPWLTGVGHGTGPTP